MSDISPGQRNLKERYLSDGVVFPVRLIDGGAAAAHRKALEQAEAEMGPMHYKPKIHTLLHSPWQIASDPAVLDVVEQLLGPDILLYNVTYIIKEAGSEAHVSWHQDLTYWGLSSDDQVSMWLALSPARAESGCMVGIPGSHLDGRKPHEPTCDQDNVLLSGQTVRGVDASSEVACELAPGEASFHHGWFLHRSPPNRSNDRRIGLNVQYIAPHVRQTKHDRDSAILVRGVDHYGHFQQDIPAEPEVTPEAMDRQHLLEQRYIQIAGSV